MRLYESFEMDEITSTLISRVRVCDAGITAALSADYGIKLLNSVSKATTSFEKAKVPKTERPYELSPFSAEMRVIC